MREYIANGIQRLKRSEPAAILLAYEAIVIAQGFFRPIVEYNPALASNDFLNFIAFHSGDFGNTAAITAGSEYVLRNSVRRGRLFVAPLIGVTSALIAESPTLNGIVSDAIPNVIPAVHTFLQGFLGRPDPQDLLIAFMGVLAGNIYAGIRARRRDTER